jgi:hypothetical protein
VWKKGDHLGSIAIITTEKCGLQQGISSRGGKGSQIRDQDLNVKCSNLPSTLEYS